MKPSSPMLKLAIGLIGISTVLYVLLAVFFHDVRDVAFYLIFDIAFIPIQVLIVTLIIDRLLEQHEKRAMLGKMNMVIGVFFNEIGTALLQSLLSFDRRGPAAASTLAVQGNWMAKDYEAARQESTALDLRAGSAQAEALDALRRLLGEKRDFLLRLLENPNLLEHEAFTQLLWAVFHLNGELAARGDLRDLPDTDYAHLAGDMKRAAGFLVVEWLTYLQHLQKDYPYLFSLAVRTNPFNPAASVIVR